MSRSTLLATANAAIEGYNTWTPDAIMSYRAPNCIHQVLPASLGRQPLNNEQYLAYFVPLMPAFKNFHVAVKSTAVDEQARQVVLHALSTAMTELGEYANEYVLTLWMTDDGTKVQKFEEFVDSKYSVEFLGKLREHLANKGAGGG